MIDEYDWALAHPPIMSNNVYFLIPLHIHLDQARLARELLLKVCLAPDALCRAHLSARASQKQSAKTEKDAKRLQGTFQIYFTIKNNSIL